MNSLLATNLFLAFIRLAVALLGLVKDIISAADLPLPAISITSLKYVVALVVDVES